jgi:hypothetical protein
MREISVRSTSTVAVSWAETCSDSTIRLAIVLRNRDIFSVVPRSELASAGAAAATGRAASAAGTGLGSASAACPSAAALPPAADDVLLADPAADARAGDGVEVDAVLLAELADEWGHVAGLGVGGHRGRCRTDGRPPMLLWLGVLCRHRYRGRRRGGDRDPRGRPGSAAGAGFGSGYDSAPALPARRRPRVRADFNGLVLLTGSEQYAGRGGGDLGSTLSRTSSSSCRPDPIADLLQPPAGTPSVTLAEGGGGPRSAQLRRAAAGAAAGRVAAPPRPSGSASPARAALSSGSSASSALAATWPSGCSPSPPRFPRHWRPRRVPR